MKPVGHNYVKIPFKVVKFFSLASMLMLYQQATQPTAWFLPPERHKLLKGESATIRTHM